MIAFVCGHDDEFVVVTMNVMMTSCEQHDDTM